MRGRPRPKLAPTPGLAVRWTALGLYTALVYGTLPYGPRLGRAVSASVVGGWLLGSGMALGVTLIVAALFCRLVRRTARFPAYGALAVAAIGYAAALAWLRAQHLERVHLPEYGAAAWLAWWALAPVVPAPGSYAAAAALAAAIGWGDELVQSVTPGRFYDLRDVAANALGAALGILLLATLRSGGTERLSAESTGRRSRRAAGS